MPPTFIGEADFGLCCLLTCFSVRPHSCHLIPILPDTMDVMSLPFSCHHHPLCPTRAISPAGGWHLYPPGRPLLHKLLLHVTPHPEPWRLKPLTQARRAPLISGAPAPAGWWDANFCSPAFTLTLTVLFCLWSLVGFPCFLANKVQVLPPYLCKERSFHSFRFCLFTSPPSPFCFTLPAPTFCSFPECSLCFILLTPFSLAWLLAFHGRTCSGIHHILH